MKSVQGSVIMQQSEQQTSELNAAIVSNLNCNISRLSLFLSQIQNQTFQL